MPNGRIARWRHSECASGTGRARLRSMEKFFHSPAEHRQKPLEPTDVSDPVTRDKPVAPLDRAADRRAPEEFQTGPQAEQVLLPRNHESDTGRKGRHRHSS